MQALSLDKPVEKSLTLRVSLGVFLTSIATLLLEISLTRIFSYTIWHHFTYVTISLAMLGFGASGVVLACSERLQTLNIKLAFRSSLIAAISVPAMLIVVAKVPFYPFLLSTDATQIIYMVLYYVAVILPFFCAGMAISCVFRNLPEASNKIYFFDLVGAGLGCFLIVWAIGLFGVPGVAALSTVFFLLAAAMFATGCSKGETLLIIAVSLLWIPIGSNVEKALDFKPSKEKFMSIMQNKKVTFSKWSPIFRVDAYDLLDDSIYRVSDGSLYGIPSDQLPTDSQYANIAHDGDGLALMIKSNRNLSAYDAFDKSILEMPYMLKNTPRVLIIGAGGGIDVGVALHNNARSVLAVELDPITVNLVSNKYADFVGHLYDRPGVRVVPNEGRSFLKRNDEKFDLIQMTGVDTLAAVSSGAYVLAENYLYTAEAYESMLDHLTTDGILSIAILDFHYKNWFPRYTVRQISLAASALKKKGIDSPFQHLAVVSATKHGFTWVLILTKMSPFTLSEISRLDQFARGLPFDIWYLPGKQLDNPCAEVVTMTDDQRQTYCEKSPLRLEAPTDDTPFFFHSFKWASVLKDPHMNPGRLATGQFVLLLTLVLSVAFSAVLIIFPLLRFQKAGLQTRWKWNYILYFTALGLGFIFIEISYIQRFILFLGYPTYSLTVVLFSLLTFSGIGSYLGGKIPLSPKVLLMVAATLLSAVALGYMKILPPIFNHFLGAPQQLRITMSLLLLFPLGLLLGMFFPTGIKMVSHDDKQFVPWAWGVNGCASVIGTMLSIIIAMSYGFSMVTILAVIVYCVGVYAMVRVGREPEPKPSNVSTATGVVQSKT